jgi:hypothetical protein
VLWKIQLEVCKDCTDCEKEEHEKEEEVLFVTAVRVASLQSDCEVEQWVEIKIEMC